MTAHLHWRIRPVQVQSDTALYLGEVRFRTAAGTDVTTGGTPIAADATDNPAYPRAQAFDKSLVSNGWYSRIATPATWIGYSFATAVDIDRVSIASNFHASGAPRDGLVWLEYSDDGVAWASLGRLFAETTFTTWAANEERLFLADVRGPMTHTLRTLNPGRILGSPNPYGVSYNRAVHQLSRRVDLAAGPYRATVVSEIKGAPNTPVAPRYVRLHDRAGSGRVVRAGWTSLVTVEGVLQAQVVFENLQFGRYYAVGFDHTGVYDGEVAVDVPLELM